MKEIRQDHKNNPVGYSLVILPAVLLGVLAMISGGVPPLLWGQQVAAMLLFGLLAWALRKAAGKIPALVWGVVFLTLLAASLAGPGTNGIRRWLDLGVFQLQAAMAVLPALLVIICEVNCPYVFMLGAAVVLCLQPDISQLTAFYVALLPILWKSGTKTAVRTVTTVGIGLLLIRCAFVPASISPVVYTEGILEMLGDIALPLQGVGWAALAMIPVFWTYTYYKQRNLLLLSLAIYYLIEILFVLTGDYPVPFMGFGLSSILGYWIIYLIMSV